jgi:hypothetical protein
MFRVSRAAIMPEAFHHIPQFLQENAGVVSCLPVNSIKAMHMMKHNLMNQKSIN